MCLRFASGKPQLDDFTDSDMLADVDTSRFTSGYVMTFAGGVVSWQLRLQKTVVVIRICVQDVLGVMCVVIKVMCDVQCAMCMV